jgi:hypothetical protein
LWVVNKCPGLSFRCCRSRVGNCEGRDLGLGKLRGNVKPRTSPTLRHNRFCRAPIHQNAGRKSTGVTTVKMDWFWGGGSKKKDDDPTKSLKPELQQFLNEQQPRPYAHVETPAPKLSKVQKDPIQLPDTNQTFEDRPLPRESLFQDGRYKDIWKTYTPQDNITAATETTVERIITAKKERKQLISRAAFENCAFEEELAKTCWTRGTKADRARALATMCSKENKAFSRCFQLQSKFMVALGYLSSGTSSAEDEEKIQMHADKLYHRMMDYEADLDDARAHGRPIPPLTSVFNPEKPAPTIEELDLPPKMEKMLSTTLSEMQPHERELAVRATLQQAKITHMYADEYTRYAIDQNEGRKGRQAWLVRVFGEPIGKFIIPDLPGRGPEAKPYSLEDLDRRIQQNERARPVVLSDANSKDKGGGRMSG